MEEYAKTQTITEVELYTLVVTLTDYSQMQ